MDSNDGKIIQRDIETEMKTSYIDYAMSVIVSRALPDVRDGLKPVHRRILYAMYEDGITSDKPYRKCANTVGSVLGRYHPHGDSSVYDAMVRMAQDFSMRYPLVDGHGNFGSIDGDGAAAMRYTEARMAKISELMLTDIEKFKIGSVYDPEVLGGIQYKNIINKLESFSKFKGSKCENCFNNKICTGCIGSNYFKTGDINDTKEDDCIMYRSITEKVILELASAN